jgi:hypothetical protein
MPTAQTQQEQVRLVDLAGTESVITRQTIEDKLLVGPAVLAPIDSITLEQNIFEVENPEDLFILVPDGKTVMGVIGLKEVTFRRCTFRDVGIVGTAATLNLIRQGFKLPPLATSSPYQTWVTCSAGLPAEAEAAE